MGERHAELVSVVIPARDAEPFIGEALDSVFAQIDEPLEVIVVNDGSVDRTGPLARGYAARVRVRDQAPAGPGAARNRGLEMATGQLIGFLDADDVWLSGSLAPRVQALRADAGLDLVFGRMSQFRGPSDAALSAVTRTLPGYVPGTLLARRSAFARVGGFREDLVAGEFIDWMARAREHRLTELMLPSHVLLRRVHATNIGVARRAASRADLVRVAKATLDRRRGLGGSRT